MLQQLQGIRPGAEPLAPAEHPQDVARVGPSGAQFDGVDIEHDRVPGPLPTIDRIEQVDRLEPAPAQVLPRAPTIVLLPAPVSAAAQVAVEAVNDPAASPDRPVPLLERLRSPLEFGFIVLLLLNLPFIVYVLCWRAGFDLTAVTYPLLTVALGGATIAVWITSQRVASRQRIGTFLAQARMLPWMSLEVFPIAGLVIWRDGGLGTVSRLIPLFVVAIAFVFTVGLPTAPGRTSTRARHWQENPLERLPQVDRSRALSRW